MEFKELKEQNARCRFWAIGAQVKSAKDEDLVNFMRHLLREVVQFHIQLNTEHAKRETSQGASTLHEKRVLSEAIDDRKAS